MEKIFKSSFDNVYAKCKETLYDLDIEILYRSRSKGIIQGKTSGSIFSWGEDIEIRITTLSGGKCKVIVTSDASAQLISWGKDSENERKILDLLSNKIGR